jgi:peptide chain release factor 1
VHTSTITVAVLPEPTEADFKLDHSDLEIKTARGSGPGGQARNKTESCVIVTHKPSGLVVRCDSERSQTQNKSQAIALLRARLQQQITSSQHSSANSERKSQIGTGHGGDKVRTIRVQDGIVKDHRLGKKIQFAEYESGNFDRLYADVA